MYPFCRIPSAGAHLPWEEWSSCLNSGVESLRLAVLLHASRIRSLTQVDNTHDKPAAATTTTTPFTHPRWSMYWMAVMLLRSVPDSFWSPKPESLLTVTARLPMVASPISAMK